MLVWFQCIRVRCKILMFVGLQAVILAVAFMVMFVSQVRKSASDEVLDSARNTLGMAKSVREGMAKKWDVGLFDTQICWRGLKRVNMIVSWHPCQSSRHGKPS